MCPPSYSRISRTASFAEFRRGGIHNRAHGMRIAPFFADDLAQISFCRSEFNHGNLLSNDLVHFHLGRDLLLRREQ